MKPCPRLPEIKKMIKKEANPSRAKLQQRYFKTGPGEYGEGDIFLGLNVPTVRRIAQQGSKLRLAELETLLKSRFHEERLCALEALVMVFERSDPKIQKQIYRIYMKNRKYINNWDLIDGSAPTIVGSTLGPRDLKILNRLARSRSLWDRRISVLATFTFIRKGEYNPSLKLAQHLLKDDEDLIHKAVGWMLREIGNKDRDVEIRFLDQHYKQMPRTMLRYAIEKFPEKERMAYLKGLR